MSRLSEFLSPESLWGRLDDPSGDAGHQDHPARKGFFTDTSVCIGCKACEVACKEWNQVPDDGYLLTGMSYDNTQQLGRQHLAPRRLHRAAGRSTLDGRTADRPGDAGQQATRLGARGDAGRGPRRRPPGCRLR